MTNYEFLICSSLEKVFPQTAPPPLNLSNPLTGLVGEAVHFQIAYRCTYTGCDNRGKELTFSARTSMGENVSLRSVALVPSNLATLYNDDDNYITKFPAMMPDLLTPLENNTILPPPGQWRALWVEWKLTESVRGKKCFINIVVENHGNPVYEVLVPVQALNASLPNQQLIHTEWFHADCLAQYYNVEVFSPEHWSIIEHFMDSAVSHGINMLLTPIFTPPLDTAPEGERLTVQLVGVVKHGELYSFDFSRLEQWLKLCKKTGIQYIEISHLFTQWGAYHCPKIVGCENGVEKKLFGWHTHAASSEYQAFLKALLPQLLNCLTSYYSKNHIYFHVSDEPTAQQTESYAAAKKMMADDLSGCVLIDALSDIDFYRRGIVTKPVVASNHIQPFLDEGVPNLWVYYCVAQDVDVSNRFMSMPSTRNRILGLQLYLYGIEGFLHWGFNFYNTQYSRQPVNPFLVTDCGGAFPSGDAFLVYPGVNGIPLESIRGAVWKEALWDLRALRLLEQLTSRSFVESMVYALSPICPITFREYPREPAFLLDLRAKINEELMKRTSQTQV